MSQLRAVVDIGSNSVRLVVYEGAARAPAPVFNVTILVVSIIASRIC